MTTIITPKPGYTDKSSEIFELSGQSHRLSDDARIQKLVRKRSRATPSLIETVVSLLRIRDTVQTNIINTIQNMIVVSQISIEVVNMEVALHRQPRSVDNFKMM